MPSVTWTCTETHGHAWTWTCPAHMDMCGGHGHVLRHMSMSTTHVHSTGDMAILLTFKGLQQYPIIFLGHCYDSSPTAHILRHTFFDNDTHSLTTTHILFKYGSEGTIGKSGSRT